MEKTKQKNIDKIIIRKVEEGIVKTIEDKSNTLWIYTDRILERETKKKFDREDVQYNIDATFNKLIMQRPLKKIFTQKVIKDFAKCLMEETDLNQGLRKMIEDEVRRKVETIIKEYLK